MRDLLKEQTTFGGKLRRLGGRFRDPEWRRYAGLLVAGKAIGLIVLALIVTVGPRVPQIVEQMLGGSPAMAQQAATAPADPYAAVKTADHINAINTVWTLLGAFLVFGMQAGFTMLEAGFCRSRETVNVLVECVFDTCLCGILFYAWGYAFMFGAGNGFIGWHDPNDANTKWFFLQGVTGDHALRRDRRSGAAPTGSSSSPSPTAPRPSAPAR
jgi:Amt family ammonium transporter